MFTDAIDKQGRRYSEVRPLPEESKARLRLHGESDQECIECGAAIRHGADRYYQRNDASDGTQGDKLEALLLALTYDAVCAACGDRAIAEGAQ